MSVDTKIPDPGAEHSLPPLVYVPTTGEEDVRQRRVIFHELLDGRTALFVYSAIDRLHEFYRPDCHWVVFDVAGLRRIHDDKPYDVLFVDRDAGLEDDAGDSLARALERAGGE